MVYLLSACMCVASEKLVQVGGGVPSLLVHECMLWDKCVLVCKKNLCIFVALREIYESYTFLWLSHIFLMKLVEFLEHVHTQNYFLCTF